jgi:hypothetical protein
MASAGDTARMEETRNEYTILVGKRLENCPLGRPEKGVGR